MTMEKAIFGAGCFWGVETAFRGVKGVSEAICGYSSAAPEPRPRDPAGDRPAQANTDSRYGNTGAAYGSLHCAATLAPRCASHFKNPTYRDVCTGNTGHAEVVQVEYDPSQVTFDALLDVFWDSHNPTTRNRQGPDIGTQYRSAIFFFTPEQEAAAKASKEKMQQSGRWRDPIVTEIAPATEFYRAEEYHQRYFEKRGTAGHCPT